MKETPNRLLYAWPNILQNIPAVDYSSALYVIDYIIRPISSIFFKMKTGPAKLGSDENGFIAASHRLREERLLLVATTDPVFEW